MSDLERVILAIIGALPTLIEAIRKWASGGSPETPLDEEVHRMLGPAEDRLVKAIRDAGGEV